MSVVRFPARHLSAIWILRLRDGWLVLHREHGWLHGNYDAAIDDAAWLATNTGLPVRRAVAKTVDLIGKRFGRLVVTAHAQGRRWSCVCDCGERVVVVGQDLRTGHTKSCGCLKRGWRLIDLAGKRFGRLLVRAYAGDRKWSCVCDCGARGVVKGQSLRTGHTKSCGCLRKARSTKHGMYGCREYRAWCGMKQRCGNPNDGSFEYYGARKISVCADWCSSFEAFFADMGTCPPGLSLDRIDVDGNYEPSNCRWTDASTQNRNRRPRQASAVVKRRRREQAERPPLQDPPF
jgi:hypothetical protein